MPQFQQFPLPDAGEGLTEADVVTWYVSVGDRVEVNQPLVEIETAKSLVELPCPFAGVVTELLADIGQVVEVGAPIVVIDVDPDGLPPQIVEGLAVPEIAAAAQGIDPAAFAELDVVAVSNMDASLIEADDEDEGQAVEPTPRTSVPIADLEAGNHAGLAGSGVEGGVADDAAVAAGAGAAGAPGGGAVLVGYGVSAAGSARRPRVGMTPTGADVPAVSAAPAPSAPAGHTPPVLAKPPVRKLARDLNIELSSVTPTGPGGIVTREDVLAHVERSAASVLATYPGDEMPWLCL